MAQISQSLPTPKNSILAMIDVQEKLAAAMPAQYLQGNIVRMSKLIKAAKAVNIPILLTEQYPQGLGPTLPAILNEFGEDLPQIITKNEFSCLRNNEIRDKLKELRADGVREHIILAGLESHICILQSAYELSAEGMNIWVIEDACLARYSEDHKLAMAYMRNSYFNVISFETILFSWIQKAATPEFKALSHLARERDY